VLSDGEIGWIGIIHTLDRVFCLVRCWRAVEIEMDGGCVAAEDGVGDDDGLRVWGGGFGEGDLG